MTLSLKVSRAYPHSPQEYLKAESCKVLPPPPLCRMHFCEAAGSTNSISSTKAAAQLEATWLTVIKTVMGVFSFQLFAESQHRHKAENVHMCHRNNSGGPLLCKPYPPICLFDSSPFSWPISTQLQGCWYIPKEKNTPEGGWGRTAHTRNRRSTRHRSTGEGFFWRKCLLQEEEGQSCKRIKFLQAVRSCNG